MKCSECGKEIHKKAEICPHCGCRVKQNKMLIVAFILIALIIIPILCFLIMLGIDSFKARKRDKERDILYDTTWELNQDAFSISYPSNRNTILYFPKKITLSNASQDNITECTENMDNCIVYFVYGYLEYGNIMTINFRTYFSDGKSYGEDIFCFDYKKDELKQINCPWEGSSGLEKSLKDKNIVFKKVEE